MDRMGMSAHGAWPPGSHAACMPPGGSVTAGLGIYDAMMLCRSDVSTLCFGLAASMGAFLLGAGQKGKRYSMPNSRIMIHQPLGGAGGQAVDMEIQVCAIRTLHRHGGLHARAARVRLERHEGCTRELHFVANQPTI